MMGVGMMGGYGSWGHPLWGLLLWLVVFVDLVLLGVWLAQKISKK